ncbi:hypothetical protein [Streptomyces sp. Isolate_45]|nr:hypothetical protein [Streptomyces sp. Isolate_45]MDA5283672.1 hypothetical protein [Streptomyces sp. Isolate_45]
MILSTLYDFFAHEVLGNTLSALLVTGTVYTARRLRIRYRGRDTDQAPS